MSTFIPLAIWAAVNLNIILTCRFVQSRTIKSCADNHVGLRDDLEWRKAVALADFRKREKERG